MPTTLYWMQCGGCSGDTMSVLNAESPDLIELFQMLDIDLLWQPSLSNGTPNEHRNLLRRMLEGKQVLDILCVEGAVLRGPSGTGMYQTFDGKPLKDILARLAGMAKYIVAIGTCASFGGISAMNESEAYGLQFLHYEKGGFLGETFKTQSGLPVINLPGCPCHPTVLTETLTVLIEGHEPELNEYNVPLRWKKKYLAKKGVYFFTWGVRGLLRMVPVTKICGIT